MAKFRKRRSKAKTRMRTRTRTRTRVVTRVRRIGSRVKRSAGKRKQSIWSMVENVVIGGSAINLLSQNQVNAVTTNDLTTKVKAMANGVLGSIININPFSDAPQAHFHPKLEGAFNQWTTTYAFAWIGGAIGKKFKLRGASKIHSVGKKGLPASIMAGIMGYGNNNPVSGKSDAYAGIRNTSQTTSVTFSSGGSNPDSPTV